MATLIDLVLALDDSHLARLSSIFIHQRQADLLTGGPWQADLHYAGCVPVRPADSARLYISDMPKGVTVTARESDDTTHELDVTDPPDPCIRAQIAALHDSRLVGWLDAARHEHEPSGRLEYVIKTHAGSDAERADWLRALNRGD